MGILLGSVHIFAGFQFLFRDVGNNTSTVQWGAPSRVASKYCTVKARVNENAERLVT